MPTRQIVQRSSGLFFLTSAINVIVLGAGGLRPVAGDRRRPPRRAAGGAAGCCRRGRRHASPSACRGSRAVSPAGARRRRGSMTSAPGSPPPATRCCGRAGVCSARWATCCSTSPCCGRRWPPSGRCRRWRRWSSPISRATSPTCCPIPGGIGILDAGLVGALGALRAAAHARRRGGARLPRGRVLDPYPRRDAGVYPSTLPPGFPGTGIGSDEARHSVPANAAEKVHLTGRD